MSRERIENEGTQEIEVRAAEGGARKHQMYQLFVLGQLMDQPMHGYLLRDILSNMLGPFRQMSWGALYPLIRQLQHNGWIELDTGCAVDLQAEANARQRKRYRITEPGKERFRAMMQEPDEYSVDTPELFQIKLVNFGRVSSELRLAILQHYLGYLHMIDNHTQMQRRHKESHLGKDMRYVLRAVYYRLSCIQTELQWVEQEIARVTEEAEQTTA
jgi:DNA-binding PadR family transcriptional regulator